MCVGGYPEMWKYFIAIEGPEGMCMRSLMAAKRSGEGVCGKTLLP